MRRGRPRSELVDEAIFRATRSLLVDGGYAEVSMDRVAARAGVAKQSVYRRWQAKGPLVAAALTDALDQAGVFEIPHIGELSDDLRSWLHDTASFHGAPEGAALVRALAAAAAESPYDSEELYQQLTQLQHQQLVQRLERARADGEIRCDVDLGTVADALLGTMLFNVLAEQRVVSETIARLDCLVDVLMNGLRRIGQPSTSGTPHD